jgi:DNA polymerase V
LRRPTADSGQLVGTAVRGLRAIFKPGFNYAKAGVMLLDLQAGDVDQKELELDGSSVDRSALMGALDTLNDRFGRSTVALASAGVAGDKRRFVMKRERKTPEYTTRWADMPTARA